MTAAQWSDGAAGPVLSLFDELTEPAGDWRDLALCAEADPEAWFPEKGGATKAAKNVCRWCDVREDCLDYALANPDLTGFGIWGGKSERERRVLRITRKENAA